MYVLNIYKYVCTSWPLSSFTFGNSWKLTITLERHSLKFYWIIIISAFGHFW